MAGKDVDVSRRVYQIEIDKKYMPKDPAAGGLTNEEPNIEREISLCCKRRSGE